MRTRVATTTTTASTRPESRTTELLLQAQHTSLQSSNALFPGNIKYTHTHTHTHNTSATPATTKQERDPTKNKKNNLNKEKLADKCST